MQTLTKDVCTGTPRKKVGEVQVPVYENVDELVKNEDAGRILGMFNKQNAVRIMGNERAKHTMTKIGKGKRFEIAYNLLRDILTPEELGEVIGNIEKLKEVIASERVQKAVDDYIASQAAA